MDSNDSNLPKPWMDDRLKKRLVGALVVMFCGFVLVSILPRPNLPTSDADTAIVTIPLREGDVVTPPPPPSSQATPPTLGLAPPDAETSAATPAAGPDEVESSAAGDDDAAGNPADAVSAPSSGAEPPAAPVIVAHAPPAASADSAVVKPAVITPTRPAAAATAAPAPSKSATVAKSSASPAPAKPDAHSNAMPGAKPPVAKLDTRPADQLAGPAASKPLAPAPTTSAAVPKAEVAAPRGAPGNWFVQTGGFAAISNARMAQQQVQAKGLNCILSPVDTDKGTIYRVRAGPFASRETAQAALAKLTAAGLAGAKLVPP